MWKLLVQFRWYLELAIYMPLTTCSCFLSLIPSDRWQIQGTEDGFLPSPIHLCYHGDSRSFENGHKHKKPDTTEYYLVALNELQNYLILTKKVFSYLHVLYKSLKSHSKRFVFLKFFLVLAFNFSSPLQDGDCNIIQILVTGAFY